MLTCLVQKLCTLFPSEFSSVRFVINLRRWGEIILREDEIHVRTTYPGIWERMVGLQRAAMLWNLVVLRWAPRARYKRRVDQTNGLPARGSISCKFVPVRCHSYFPSHAVTSDLLSVLASFSRDTLVLRAYKSTLLISSGRALRFFTQIIKYYI